MAQARRLSSLFTTTEDYAKAHAQVIGSLVHERIGECYPQVMPQFHTTARHCAELDIHRFFIPGILRATTGCQTDKKTKPFSRVENYNQLRPSYARL